MPSDFFDELTEQDNPTNGAQTGNAQQAAPFEDDDNSLMSGFESSFNEAISARLEQNKPKDNSASGAQTGGDKLILGKFKSEEDLARAYQNLERQHTVSRQELARLEKAKPLIDAITEDEGLYQLIDDYFRSPDSDRQKRALGLPEDFQMDMNEAIQDPNSDSAKVLAKIVESQASKIVEQREAAARTKQQLSRQAEDLKSKYGLNDDQITELVRESQSIPLTLEDVFLLRNKDNILGAAKAKGAQDLMAAQKKAKGITPSGARAGTSAQRGKAFIDELLEFDNKNSFNF